MRAGETAPGRRLRHAVHGSSLIYPSREPFLDLVHQRVGEPGLSQFVKIFKEDGLPRLPVLHILFTAIAKIDCSRLVCAVEEHERMSAVHVEPLLIGRDGDRQVGGFERLREVLSQNEPVR
jgi:hypothetical protein